MCMCVALEFGSPEAAVLCSARGVLGTKTSRAFLFVLDYSGIILGPREK